MATYKVLQDIEAEDKLLGPLTLRQFVYGAVAVICLYLSYFLTTKGAAFMTVFFLPIAAATGFFAFPWGRDQPTEVWALAKIRFLLKPRRRVWDQSGIKELVTITAPKQIAVNYTNGLSQDEVRSRLQALANTIDTRGWAVKNAGVSFSQASVMPESDRLVAPAQLPKPVDDSGITASDDIMDEKNNAGAQRLQSMIDQSAKAHRDKIVENLNNNDPGQDKKPGADYWFLNQPSRPASIPSNMVTFNTQVVSPGADDGSSASPPAVDEASLVAELDAHKKKSEGAYYGHMHTIKPISEQDTPAAQPPLPPTPAAFAPPMPSQAIPAPQPPAAPTAPPAPATPQQNANAPVTPAQQAAILQLANNNDLNVATIAREAERSAPQTEVVIKLH